MLCRTTWFFVILCSYVNIVKSITSNRNSFSEIQVKYHKFQNGRLQKIISDFQNGKTRTKIKTVKRAATMIVNDDFDIPSDINDHKNSSEIGVLNEYEGSGIDEFGEKELSKTTIFEAKSEYEYLRKITTTAILTQSTTNAVEPVITVDENKISTLIDAESSGDDILLFTKEYATTEVTTESRVKLEQEIPDICLNSTCNVNDLSISASDDRCVIAEGTNFTLSCKSNYSNHMLYWYKSNGSVYFLQAFGTEEKLHLNIPDTKPIHSGKYICVRWVDKQTCCSLQSHLSVYDLPLYKYHLIIIGLIAVICLIICIFLSVRQVMSLNTYTKQFAEKHGTVKKQLL